MWGYLGESTQEFLGSGNLCCCDYGAAELRDC